MGLVEALEKVKLVDLEKAAWDDVRPAVDALLDAKGVRDFKALILTVADALVKKGEDATEKAEGEDAQAESQAV